MERKVVITECLGRIVTALLENQKVVELHYSPVRQKETCRVGEIYVGKVKTILPNIHGAFVEIGNGQECYYSLEEKTPPVFTRKNGKKTLCVGDELLVQVQKEAVKTKQPTVTGNLSFTGKYVVLTSGNQKIGVSSKLSRERREELLAWGKRYADMDCGIIFRTNAGEAAFETLEREIDKLLQEYQKVMKWAGMRTCYSLIYKVPEPETAILRDLRQDGLTEIIVDASVDNGGLYREIEKFLKTEQTEDLPLLRAYQDTSYPLSKCYALEHVTEEARKERVWMNSGAYLVIQPTEALTVIDVNSGKCQKKNKKFREINQEAAKEAARQIRLRNLTGIIIIDFINMRTKEELEELIQVLRKEFLKDSNPAQVVDITRLQLVEITRKKVRKTLEESLHG